MRNRYDRAVTRYICKRCDTPIEVPSDTFYEFAGEEDSACWCPSCEDLPAADIDGVPAHELPNQLPLQHGFTLQSMPRIEPGEDSKDANLQYRPYSKRSFLQQYLEWLTLKGARRCNYDCGVSTFKKFDNSRQRYTDEIDYSLVDQCDDHGCQFLRTETLKPVEDGSIYCGALRLLCNVQSPHGLCQTRDEAYILRNYLLISGGDHYPMMIPQPSIFSGKKRPDFIYYIPITKFQYRPVVVLVDRPGKPPAKIKAENDWYESKGFVVNRIEVNGSAGFSYFKAARELKNWVESQEVA